MTGDTDRKERRSAEAIKAFRQRYRRFDYYPTASALAVIERVRAEHFALSARQVIDGLVTAGERYFRK